MMAQYNLQHVPNKSILDIIQVLKLQGFYAFLCHLIVLLVIEYILLFSDFL